MLSNDLQAMAVIAEHAVTEYRIIVEIISSDR